MAVYADHINRNIDWWYNIIQTNLATKEINKTSELTMRSIILKDIKQMRKDFGDYELQRTDYSPNNLGKLISGSDAKKYGIKP